MKGTWRRTFIIFSLFLFTFCTTTQTASTTDSSSAARKTSPPENPAGWSPAEAQWLFMPGYTSTPPRKMDLVHMRLEGFPHWVDATFPATATLTLTPHFYPQTSVSLDARGMLINEVKIAGAPTTQYTYDQNHLHIPFIDTLFRGDTITLTINYVARPELLRQRPDSLGRVQTGLHFIDPHDTIRSLPRQVWTQGQTSGAGSWFPTIDHPNQRMTQEIIVTVADSLTTFSNGQLIKSRLHMDGQRTDHWQLDKPHPPYLAALAIGTFAIAADTAAGVPLYYYVDPPFARHAKQVFGATAPMMELYVDKLNTPFPWPAYRQVAVHEFVAGGMENTGATIMYSRMNTDTRSLLDRNFEGLIAHELFHQWFGDLVTTESWPQLVLNEGMASFGEYIWYRHKDGPDGEQYHAYRDRLAYFEEAADTTLPVLRYYLNNPGQMFNRHTYQKGALIFRMLEDYIGRDAFWEGLSRYLKRHAYQPVDVDQMRLAFEEVSGMDLRWFFNQWMLSDGHPTIEIRYATHANGTHIFLSQTHPDAAKIYRLPITIYTPGHQYFLDWHSRDTMIAVEASPEEIHVDPERLLVAEYQDNRTSKMHEIALQSGSIFERILAINYFSDSATYHAPALLLAMQDPYPEVRKMAINKVQPQGGEASAVRSKLIQMATQDPEAQVRSTALMRLLSFDSDALEPLYQKALSDSAYGVQSSGLIGLTQIAPEKAAAAATAFENTLSGRLRNAVAYTYAYTTTTAKDDFFYAKDYLYTGFERLEWLDYFTTYFQRVKDTARLRAAIQLIAKDVQKNRYNYVSYMAFKMIQRLRSSWQTEMLELEENGTDPERLKAWVDLDQWTESLLTELLAKKKGQRLFDRLKVN